MVLVFLTKTRTVPIFYDVIESLTDSKNPRDYWYKMKVREKTDSDVQLSTICRQLKLIAPDGKKILKVLLKTRKLLKKAARLQVLHGKN